MAKTAARCVALNGYGIATWSPPSPGIGTHSASATYAGDASFQASSSSPVNFTVTKGIPSAVETVVGYGDSVSPQYDVPVGDSITLNAKVGPQFAESGTAPPTGTVTFCLDASALIYACSNPAYSATVNLAQPAGTYSQYSYATVTFTNLAAGDYLSSFQYNGDANWQPYGELVLDDIAVAPQPALANSTTTLTITPSTISGTQLAQVATTVTGTGDGSVGPTGVVDYYVDGIFYCEDLLQPSQTSAARTHPFAIDAASLWNAPGRRAV